MRIYFAAPLFSEAERAFNDRVAGRLEAAGHSVFLPQRDGYEAVSEAYEEPGVETEADALREIFRLDRSEILEADVLTAVLDGRVPDEGVCIELGVAHENDTPVIGLKTDVRVFSAGESLNAMVFSTLSELTEDVDTLVETVASYEG